MTKRSPADSRRWEPDDQLIAAVRCGTGSQRMVDLCDADRAWVVAGLTLDGWTADDIKDRLRCSLRQVRAIRATDIAQVCLILQRESRNFADQMALAASEMAAVRRDLAAITAEATRSREQLGRVIDARLVGQRVDTCPQGAHLMVDWNIRIDANGRRRCRECHAQRQRDYRLARKLGVPIADVRAARLANELEALIDGAPSVTPAGITV